MKNNKTTVLNKKNSVSDNNHTAPKARIKMHAWQDSQTDIVVKFEKALPSNTDKSEFWLRQYNNDTDDYNTIEVSGLSFLQTATDGSTTIKLTAERALEVDKALILEHDSCITAQIRPRLALNDSAYYYEGQLGCHYSKEQTQLTLWAPTAHAVEVRLYSNDHTRQHQTIAMTRGAHGEWSTTLIGDMNGKYYLYAVHLTTFDTHGMKDKVNIVADPYSTATSPNSAHTLIYNPAEISLSVTGWDSDHYVQLNNNTDAILYEMHIRDMTISPTAGVKDTWRGTFLGLTEENTISPNGAKTALSHLLELGITHAHLMPVFDYATGDETEDSRQATWYNWGYDPILYNNIEGSYATDAHGTHRQHEFKELVAAFHRHNLGVVCDVVYNHTYHTGTTTLSIFDKIVPGYYYRLDNSGNYLNGSGCGNDVASERPMVRKFIVDSCKFWVQEYHIDGLRFDLMGLIDRTTMQTVYNEVKKINPFAIIYGEGWNIPTGIPDEQRTNQENVRGTGIAAFNDGFRDSLKGDVFKQNVPGFVQGSSPYLGLERLMFQIKGQETGRAPLPIEITTPNETVNYVSAHDNACLWDKLAYTNPDSSIAMRKKMVQLATAVVLTSQGIPFFSEGDEFCRSKNGNENSYNNNEPNVNPINWNTKTENIDVFNYYKGLIALRKAHAAFRIAKREMVDSNLHFIARQPNNIITYLLFDHANGDTWENIFVCYNSTEQAHTVNLSGIWNIVVDDKTAGITTLRQTTDTITIEPLSALVAWH